MGLVPYERDTRETALCELGSGLSSDIESIGAFILDFPTSRTVRNEFVVCKPRSLYYFVIAPCTD